ncbi:MAG: hypothetical protein ACREVV_07405 [Steroidobacteraceae bacterium]
MKLTVVPVTPDRWCDLEAVFNAKGCSVARGCWCMAYRLSGSNCGVDVLMNGANAINNYWGSPRGPGSDPADNVGEKPVCNGTIANHDAGLPPTKPFATQAFAVL